MATRDSVRMIGGRWRGRRIVFPAVEGLRPSPDRVRETLFNWLGGYLPGSRCLDLYAGSGVIGFEALSRGAAHVTFVDLQSAVIAALKNTAQQLDTRDCIIVQTDAVQFLEAYAGPLYDIVFMDPPFHQGRVSACFKAAMLWAKQWIYVEAETPITIAQDGWALYRAGVAGQVHYHLFKRMA